MDKAALCMFLLPLVRHISCQSIIDSREWVSAGEHTSCHSSEQLNDDCVSSPDCRVYNFTSLADCQSLGTRIPNCSVDYRPGLCHFWRPAARYFKKLPNTSDRQCWKRVLKGECRLGSSFLKCKAKNIIISGYSAGDLISITGGLAVSQAVSIKAGDIDSCPEGYKIWSPRNKADWTAVYSAMDKNINNYPGKDGMVVDVFRTQDGCGDCADYAMNSNVSEQSSWQTSDGSAWWLRDTPYTPDSTSGDGYKATNLLRVTDVNPNGVKFAFSANPVAQTEYLCQRIERTTRKTTPATGDPSELPSGIVAIIVIAVIAGIILLSMLPVAVWYMCKRRKERQEKYKQAQPALTLSLQSTTQSYGNSSQARKSYGNSSYRQTTSTSPRQLAPTSSTRLKTTSPRQITATSSKRLTAKSSKRLTAKSSRRMTTKSSKEMILSMKWGGDSFMRSDRNLRLSEAEYEAITDEIYEYYKVKITGHLDVPVPLTEGRTFIDSNYKKMYTAFKKSGVPFQVNELLFAVESVIENFAAQFEDLDSDGFLRKFNADANARRAQLKGNVEKTAELFWTSPHCLNETEFCSMLNEAIREDNPEFLMHAMVVVCALNRLRVTARSSRGAIQANRFPTNGVSWRGSCLPDEHQSFFTEGKIFRVPAYLATSFRENVALSFIERSDGTIPPCLWRVLVDPRGKMDPLYRCKHASYVNITQVKGEGEYLFAPYSVFTVETVRWSLNPKVPHRIHLRAALDNNKESEAVPLSPWY